MAAAASLLACTGADGHDGMFSFFSKKPSPDSTRVNPLVGAELVRVAAVPAAVQATMMHDAGSTDGVGCPKLLLQGEPPNARPVGAQGDSSASKAFVIAGDGHPPLAVVGVSGSRPHVELWEMTRGTPPAFARQRPLRLDPRAGSWVGSFVDDVACLPQQRALLAVTYDAPRTEHGLFLYDVTHDSSTRIASVASAPEDPERLFDARALAPGAVLVHFGTDRTRAAAEVYYNALEHVWLFDARHPDGVEILTLSAADGSIDRWTVAGGTLWLHLVDRRDPRTPRSAALSLDLAHLVP